MHPLFKLKVHNLYISIVELFGVVCCLEFYEFVLIPFGVWNYLRGKQGRLWEVLAHPVPLWREKSRSDSVFKAGDQLDGSRTHANNFKIVLDLPKTYKVSQLNVSIHD